MILLLFFNLQITIYVKGKVGDENEKSDFSSSHALTFLTFRRRKRRVKIRVKRKEISFTNIYKNEQLTS